MDWHCFFHYFRDWRCGRIYEAAFVQQITVEEQKQIRGGAKSSLSSIINAVVKAAAFLLDLGRNVGSSIRQARTRNWC